MKDEEQDFTGDSGFSASSRYYDDHDAYCVVDLWRRPPATRSRDIHCVLFYRAGWYAQTSYVYSLLMRATKLETAADQGIIGLSGPTMMMFFMCIIIRAFEATGFRQHSFRHPSVNVFKT